MIAHRTGTLSATTAFGKTVFAIAMIAKRKVNTLILVHNKALLAQWNERLEQFLEIDEAIDKPHGKRGRKKDSSTIGLPVVIKVIIPNIKIQNFHST